MDDCDLDIVLASGSPRRRELLSQAGVAFRTLAVDVDESLEPDQQADPEAACKMLAERKARAAVEALLTPDYVGTLAVIGADTMVVCQGRIFGKPADAAEARAMLRELSGRTHQVITAVSLWAVHAPAQGDIDLGFRTFADTTQVRFGELTDQQIDRYVATGDPLDKAGAYGIQSPECDLVEAVEGRLDTVIGLPVEPLMAVLGALGS